MGLDIYLFRVIKIPEADASRLKTDDDVCRYADEHDLWYYYDSEIMNTEAGKRLIKKFKDYFFPVKVYYYDFDEWFKDRGLNRNDYEWIASGFNSEENSWTILFEHKEIGKKVVVYEKGLPLRCRGKEGVIFVKELGYQRGCMNDDFYKEIVCECNMGFVLTNEELKRVKKYVEKNDWCKKAPILNWKLGPNDFVKFSY